MKKTLGIIILVAAAGAVLALLVFVNTQTYQLDQLVAVFRSLFVTTEEPSAEIPGIVASYPPDGAVDARLHSDWHRFYLLLSQDPPLTIRENDFIITSSLGVAAQVIAFENVVNVAGLTLNRFILPGERIKISHLPTNTFVCLASLPGDHWADGRVNSSDLGAFRARMADNSLASLPTYQTDINGDRSVDEDDLQVIRQILSGGNSSSGLSDCSDIAPGLSSVIFVDPAGGSCSDYSPQTRTCGGGSATAYADIQTAVEATAPGHVIYLRGGDYHHLSPDRDFVTISISGTAEEPITIQNYEDETVRLLGQGFAEDGSDLLSNEALLRVSGDYVAVRGLEFSQSGRYGVYNTGDYNTFEDLKLHDNWEYGLYNKDASYTTVRNVEAYNNRHQSGVFFAVASEEASHNVVENVLSYNNGRLPDGTKVPAVDGDPAGGGNSDALAFSKDCVDLAPSGGNLCNYNVLKNVIGFGNTDDGLDVSMSHSRVEDVIMFENGPEGNRGYKILRSAGSEDVSYIGSIAFRNQSNGFDVSLNESTPRGLVFYNSLALKNGNRGIHDFDTNSIMRNTLSAFNTGADIFDNNCGDCDYNWAADGSADGSNSGGGDPLLVNQAAVINTTFLPSWTLSQKMAYIRDQFKNHFGLRADSPLIDAGVVVPGVHCPVPGPYPGEGCRQWCGLAPDIGPFEFGSCF